MSLSQLSGARLPNEQSIRILTLKSGRPDDPLEGSLDSVGIEETGQYEVRKANSLRNHMAVR